MDKLYQKIIKQIILSGKRLRKKAGKLQDIGVTKKNLTEEDIRIERELKQIIKNFDPTHQFYAEEENDNFLDAKDVWVVDPISGTRAFIKGFPHYGIVAAHIHKDVVQFAAVYDPFTEELYTACKGQGAFLNNKKISVNKVDPERTMVIINLTAEWKNVSAAREVFSALSSFDLYRVPGSHALNDCQVASGKYNGVVCLAKDSFSYFASSLIVREAGGIFTNIEGEEKIKPSDRIFIGGDKATYQRLKLIVDKILK